MPDPAVPSVEESSSDGGVSIAVGVDGVAHIALRRSGFDDLISLGRDIVQVFNAAVAGLVAAHSQGEADPPGYALLKDFAADLLRNAPEVVSQGTQHEVIEESGIALHFEAGALVGVVFDEQLLWTDPISAAEALQRGLNRGFSSAESAQILEPQPATAAEMDELIARIHDVKRGIYR